MVYHKDQYLDVVPFANDTNVLRKVNIDGDKQHLQNDLDKLVK